MHSSSDNRLSSKASSPTSWRSSLASLSNWSPVAGTNARIAALAKLDVLRYPAARQDSWTAAYSSLDKRKLTILHFDVMFIKCFSTFVETELRRLNLIGVNLNCQRSL